MLTVLLAWSPVIVGGWLSPYLYCGLTLMPLVRMSFSAMPAALIAAITLFICVALAASAALASAAWVTTPVDSDAPSGTRLASAWAGTEGSGPSDRKSGGWGKRGAVRVDLGGRRSIKKKKKKRKK